MRDRLSRAISAVLAAAFPSEDWDLAAYGDCTDLLSDHQDHAYSHTAARFGYTLDGLLRAVEFRTSPRWVHFNLPISRL